jgi:dihydropyrimidine dehydrogenase (NAD+) subunit PreT
MNTNSTLSSYHSEPEVMNHQAAYKEACRCLLCLDAPCDKGCPAQTNPSKFIRQIRFLNLKGAYRTILKNNILGGVCALVCPVDKLCVKECLRSGIDVPIKINALQRFAVDSGRKLNIKVREKLPSKKEKVAIIGSGPSGLSAANELIHTGYQVKIFDSEEKYGGTLRYGVPSFRCPEKELDADINVLEKSGVSFQFKSGIKDFENIRSLLDSGFSAVFIAAGLQKPYTVQVKGCDLKGVTTAKDFLRSAKKDCEKGSAFSLVHDKNIAVIGGGSVAMDAANTCRALGAKRIYAISLESLKELPASRDDLALAQQNFIIFKPQCRITEILGNNGYVTGIKGMETEWIEPDNFLPSNARQIPDTSFTLKVDAVIQAIGLAPSDENEKILASLQRKGKYISADENTLQTSIKGIFAGGDIIRGGSTVVQAVADGKKAAKAIDDYLKNKLE